MTYSFDEYNYVIKLTQGERLTDALEQFMRETKINGAWLNGLGGATNATLGFYDLAAQTYQWQTFNDLREVLSLTGNIALDETGKPMFHLHGVLGDREYQTVGGHVKELVAGATLELFVHRTWKPLARKKDSEVGLQTLDLEK